MTTTEEAQPEQPATPPATGPLITEPGLYDLTAEEYHRDPVVGGSLSSTGARKLLDCPAKYRAYIDGTLEETGQRTLDAGKAAHALMLGTGPELYVAQHDGRTTKGKDERAEALARDALVVTQTDYKVITGMADALRRHPIAADLLDPDSGYTEQTIVWRDERTGVMRRAMLDYLPHWARTSGNFIVPDYKTGKSAQPREIEKAIANYGYHVQGEFYNDGVRALGLAGSGIPAFVLIFQEKTSPYVVTVVQYTSQEREMARVMIDKAVDLYAECNISGVWPGYADDRIVPVQVPQWQVRAFEDAEDAGAYTLSTDPGRDIRVVPA